MGVFGKKPEQEESVYQTNYMGFWIKVYSNRVDFKSGTGIHSFPLNEIASVQAGVIGMMGVTLVTIIGERHMIPTSKKKEVQQAVNDAKARSDGYSQLQTNIADMSNMMPIDEYVAQLKGRRDTLQLELDSVNTQMSNIRAHYQQSRSNFIFKESVYSKNSQLKNLQPAKEKLQRELLAMKTEITHMQTLKKQGMTAVNTKP